MMYGLLVFVLILALWVGFRCTKKAENKAIQYVKEDNGPLTAEQIALIRKTWALVLPMKAKAAGLFYGRLFELDPSLKPLFRGNLNFQGDKLMTTLNVVVNSLDNLADIEPMLSAMGERHVIYGVKTEHYETVGAAFLWVLEQGLAENFTDEVRDVWLYTYGLIADAMKVEAA